jgi:hypothetical protein
MPTYKFNLHSGQAFTAEDKRALQKLSADLCTDGFIVVQRDRVGYSTDPKPISLLNGRWRTSSRLSDQP